MGIHLLNAEGVAGSEVGMVCVVTEAENGNDFVLRLSRDGLTGKQQDILRSKGLFPDHRPNHSKIINAVNGPNNRVRTSRRSATK